VGLFLKQPAALCLTLREDSEVKSNVCRGALDSSLIFGVKFSWGNNMLEEGLQNVTPV
jgi:hypothetical protein